MNRAARLRRLAAFHRRAHGGGLCGILPLPLEPRCIDTGDRERDDRAGLRPTYRKRPTNWDGPSRWERSGTRWESSSRGAWSTSWVGVETT